jgi:hypothetical protein
MSTANAVSLLVSIIALTGTIIGYAVARRKNEAETRQADSTAQKIEIESLSTMRDLIKKMESDSIVEYNRIRDQLDSERLQRENEVDKIKHQIEIEKTKLEESRIEAEKLRSETKGLQQSRHYQNYRDAFQDIEKYIEEYLNDYLEHGIKEPLVDLKLIAVAMTFSWDFFIVTAIPRILRNFHTSKIKLDVLFVDYKHLNLAKTGKDGVNWGEISEIRLKEVREFASRCQDYNGRLVFTAKTYKNIPHWHGWLINDQHLFLGRTDWTFDGKDNKPQLRVGQNEYRHFDGTSAEGARRIDLFQRWQKYYYEFASEPIVNSEDLAKNMFY